MKNAKPAQLYALSDEIGQQVTFVGNGNFGNGLDGITNTKAILRAATNLVTSTDKSKISFIFDEPKSALTLEGISGPHDSGGPAFIEKDGQLYIAGVSSWQDNQGVEGVYGVVEHYARVSTQHLWINTTIKKYNPVPVIKHPILTSIATVSVKSLQEQLALYPTWRMNTSLTTAILTKLIYQLPIKDVQLIISAVPELTTLKLNNISLPNYTIEQGNWKLFEYLIEYSTNINEQNIYGESYLTQLLMLYPPEFSLSPLLEKLLTKGLDINSRDDRGNTALALATYLANRDNNLERVKLLLEKGANANLGDASNFTPLMYTATAANKKLATLLIKYGAKLDTQDSSGKTALDYAMKHDQNSLIHLLKTDS